MVGSTLPLAVAALGASLVHAAPSPAPELDFSIVNRVAAAGSSYAPTSAVCPSTPLVRPAQGLNSLEEKYIASRHPKASAGLAAWLKQRGKFPTKQLPTVALASSGGGLRALLSTAGVIKALDGRDTDFGTSGLYQGLTYESGLSGGAWFLSSLAGNNWPTVSSLQCDLWEPAFAKSVLLPAYILSSEGSPEYSLLVKDIAAKHAAGYNVSIVDAWGRLLSYSLLYGKDGGVADRLSGLTSLSNFTSAQVPFPIMTALGNLYTDKGQCYPTVNSSIYEFTPYEYGSWDKGVSAFAQSKYMGSNISNGQPVHPKRCTQNYDNLGLVLGTSSDVFNAACPFVIPPSNGTDATDLPGVLSGIVSTVQTQNGDETLSLYPNPFYKYARSTLVSDDPYLTLSDGGEADQNIPIWPFVAGPRNVDVLIASDNSADTTDNFPDGTEIYTTYLNSIKYGYNRMPTIPDSATFVAQGLNKRATFFGCNSPASKMLIVYLPNVNYTFPSNESTLKLQYFRNETRGMIHNGVEIGTQNGDEQWPFCLACAVAKKGKSGEPLPNGCGACFKKYCYTSS